MELELLRSTDSFRRDFENSYVSFSLLAPGFALGLLVGGARQVPQLQLQLPLVLLHCELNV